jgi:hypothetical protein
MPQGAPTISRLDSANAQAVMERVTESGAIEGGRAVVISVSAIRDRVGDRWVRRRDDVYAYVNRKLAEHLTYSDLHHRLNDTDFLIAMTSQDAASAPAVAMHILEEVLVYFLGAADTPDVRIQIVTAFGGDGLSCAPLDPTKIDRRPVSVAAPRNAFAPSVDPDLLRMKSPVSFVTASGLDLRIDFAVERLVSLRHEITAALRIEPTVTHVATDTVIPSRNFGRLSDSDLAMIDKATIEYGGLYLPKSGVSRQHPPVILPSSLRTLISRRGRANLALAAGGAADLLKTGVIVELIDVTIGTPGSSLMEVAGLVGSLCRAVFIRLHPAKDMMAPVRGIRPQGLTLDAADLGQSDAQIASSIIAFGEQARHVAPFLAVQGLPAEGFFQVATVAHLSHAALRGATVTAEEQAA